MCRVCEHPCWRDGGEGECDFTDEEFVASLNQLDTLAGTLDLMERLQFSLAASKRKLSVQRSNHLESE